MYFWSRHMKKLIWGIHWAKPASTKGNMPVIMHKRGKKADGIVSCCCTKLSTRFTDFTFDIYLCGCHSTQPYYALVYTHTQASMHTHWAVSKRSAITDEPWLGEWLKPFTVKFQGHGRWSLIDVQQQVRADRSDDNILSDLSLRHHPL